MALLPPFPYTLTQKWGPTANVYEPAMYGYLGRAWWNWQPYPFKKYYHFHPGIDLAAPAGTPIYASESGIVTAAGWNGSSGLRVNVTIRYSPHVKYVHGHMQSIAVVVGQKVKRGQLLGRVGKTGTATGPHSHFGIQIGSMLYDPRLFLPGGYNANDWRIKPVY